MPMVNGHASEFCVLKGVTNAISICPTNLASYFTSLRLGITSITENHLKIIIALTDYIKSKLKYRSP